MYVLDSVRKGFNKYTNIKHQVIVKLKQKFQNWFFGANLLEAAFHPLGMIPNFFLIDYISLFFFKNQVVFFYKPISEGNQCFIAVQVHVLTGLKIKRSSYDQFIDQSKHALTYTKSHTVRINHKFIIIVKRFFLMINKGYEGSMHCQINSITS